MPEASQTWLGDLPALTSRMREQLRAAYWQGLLHAPLPAVLSDLEGRVLAANAPFERLVGLDETELHGRLVVDLAHADDRTAVAEVVRALRTGEVERADYEARWVRGDGRVAWTRRHVFRVDDEGTGQSCLAALVEDVTEERLAQRQAVGLVDLTALVAEGAPLPDVAERVAALAEDRWSGVTCVLSLLDEPGAALLPVAHDRLPGEWLAALPAIEVGLEGGALGLAAEERRRVVDVDLGTRDDGSRFGQAARRLGAGSAWSVPVSDPTGAVVGALGVLHRVAQEPAEEEWQALENLARVLGTAVFVDRQRVRQREREAELRRDPTTGLPNLVAFLEAIGDDSASPAPLSVGVVRVHDLAGLSSALGGDTAEQLLTRMAARLRAMGGVRAVALVGPMTLAVATGDEWGAREASLLRRALLQPVEVAGSSLRLDLRVGVACKPAGTALQADALLHDAFIAMPEAPGAAAFDPAAVQAHLVTYALAGEVARALRAREVVVHYQPKYDLATGRQVGSEALVRWLHPQRGLLPPGEFLRAVELAGAMSDLALHVVRRVVEEAGERRANGLLGRVAVNLTADDLRNEQVVEFLCDVEERRWEHVDIELTEAVLADAACVSAMERLVAQGYDIALDDFGTGYSSLSALHAMPVCTVKIDRSFVQRLPGDQSAEALVGAVAAMCGHLGVSVVAEGIETPEQAAALARLGCGVGQGYLLRRPLPAGEQFGGSVVLGVVTSGVTLEQAPPAPSEDALALALRLHDQGASPQTVAAALNRAGHRTPGGSRWQSRAVEALLRAVGTGDRSVDTTRDRPGDSA